eukprot:1467322-Amphidinium_carterae.1
MEITDSSSLIGQLAVVLESHGFASADPVVGNREIVPSAGAPNGGIVMRRIGMNRDIPLMANGVRGASVPFILESAPMVRQAHLKDTFQNAIVDHAEVLTWDRDLLHLEIQYIFMEATNPTELVRKRWQVLRAIAPFFVSLDEFVEHRAKFLPDSKRRCMSYCYFNSWLFCMHRLDAEDSTEPFNWPAGGQEGVYPGNALTPVLVLPWDNFPPALQ